MLIIPNLWLHNDISSDFYALGRVFNFRINVFPFLFLRMCNRIVIRTKNKSCGNSVMENRITFLSFRKFRWKARVYQYIVEAIRFEEVLVYITIAVSLSRQGPRGPREIE